MVRWIWCFEEKKLMAKEFMGFFFPLTNETRPAGGRRQRRSAGSRGGAQRSFRFPPALLLPRLFLFSEDPFPMPDDAVLRCHQRYQRQRPGRAGSKNRRLEQTVSSLNGLFSSSGGVVTPSPPLAAATANASQKAVLARLGK